MCVLYSYAVKRLHAYIYGRVQGVGFRYFMVLRAKSFGLVGYVRNLPDGRVEVVAEGDEENLKMLLEELKKGPPGAYVENVDYEWSVATGGFDDFRITY